MAAEPEVIAAIEASVEAAPDNVALRLHLAGLLVEAERWAEALDHAALVLQRRPADRPALEIAAAAADHVDAERADGYRALLDALAGRSSAPSADEELEAT